MDFGYVRASIVFDALSSQVLGRACVFHNEMPNTKPKRIQSTKRSGSNKAQKKVASRAQVRRRQPVRVRRATNSFFAAGGAVVRRPTQRSGLVADVRDFLVPVPLSAGATSSATAVTYNIVNTGIAGFDAMSQLWENVAVEHVKIAYDPISAIAHDGQIAIQWELDTSVVPTLTYDAIIVNTRTGLAITSPLWSSVKGFSKPPSPNDRMPTDTQDTEHRICANKKFGFSVAVIGYRPNTPGVDDRIGTLTVVLRLKFTGRRLLPAVGGTLPTLRPTQPPSPGDQESDDGVRTSFSAAPSGVDRGSQ